MVQVGDVYDITAENSRRWNGQHKVIAVGAYFANVESLSTGERNNIKLHLLETWPKVKVVDSMNEIQRELINRVVKLEADMRNAEDLIYCLTMAHKEKRLSEEGQQSFTAATDTPTEPG